ncbi:unnamed protein product [Adineta ricciae]|uniref:Uncharacterized protein n=1 Tax=Adineta ricciae TaxID=249248 RepID=A0A813X7K7_ADIRI|nr:unnamed protein product [Adineta ricciae]
MSTADSSRLAYNRFLEYENVLKSHAHGLSRPYNATPIGFCAFSLTLFVYSFYLAGATVPVTSSASIAMGLGLFYGGLVELIAGVFELRIGNNFYALTFLSYAGYWLGLASLYVSGSFGFTTGFLTGSDNTALHNAMGVFYLAWTIFTLAMLISSIRTNVINVVFFFFLMLVYILLCAGFFLDDQYNLRRAAGAIGIFTAVVGWYKAFASLLIKGDNSYFDLPLFDISRRSTEPGGPKVVETRANK